MKNLVRKIIVNILIIAIFCVIFQNICLARYESAIEPGGRSGTISFSSITPNSTVSGASDTSGAAKSVQNIIQAILTVTQVVGVGVAVIMLIVLAIKYISAAPGDKAEIKKHAVVYVVGAVVLFSAAGILQIIKNFAGNVKPA